MTIRDANEWSDVYGSIGAAPRVQLMQIPMDMLDPWQDLDGNAQPFKPYSQAMLQELAENIRCNGVIEPINARPRNGRFQIIAGHNRCTAAQMAGLSSVPALVEDLSDDAAVVKMVDSNLLHRDTLLPSEKAFAYRLRLESLNRQGQRTDVTSSPMETKSRSDTELADKVGESRSQIQRYIRLTYLIPAFLDMVDKKKFGFRAAVEISYLSQQEQQLLMHVLISESLKAPNLDKANALHRASKADSLTMEEIYQILLNSNEEKKEILKIPSERLRDFFPSDTSVQEMEDTIYEALAAYIDKGKDHDL